MKKGILAGLLAIAFILLGACLHTKAVSSFDRNIGDFFYGLRSEALTPAVQGISELGTTKGYVIALALVLVITLAMRRWRTAVWLTLGIATGWLANKALKAIYNRERPQHWEMLAEPDGSSFPSGNAMVSAAFYGLMALILLRSEKGGLRALGGLLLLAIVIIGLSRLYLGVHYASDIAGGFIAGSCIALLCYMGWKASEKK